MPTSPFSSSSRWLNSLLKSSVKCFMDISFMYPRNHSRSGVSVSRSPNTRETSCAQSRMYFSFPPSSRPPASFRVSPCTTRAKSRRLKV